MSKHKPVYLSLALLLLLGLASSSLAACQPTAPTASPTSTVVKPSAAATPGAVTGTFTGPLHREQVFRPNLGQEPPTLDPNKAEDTTSIAVLNPMYEGLTRFRPDLTIEPAMAETWSFSDDGKTVTFKIREAKWSDGTAVTAKDFEYSWKRLIDPRTASHYAFILTDEIVGAEQFNAAKVPTDTAKLPQLEAAVGVKAVDDKTFQVNLKNPATYFLSVAALWAASPLNRAAVEKGGAKWTEPPNHVSNGPFVLKEWQHQSKIVLEPNPNYWGPNPTLTRIEMPIITDQKAALEAYKNNEIDVVFPADADIPGLRADPVLSKEIIEIARLATEYIGFNSSKDPFVGEKGKLVRQAFSQAIDRKAFVDVILRGVGTPATSFVPPGLFGHQSDVGFKFDPAKAKETLQKAGYADGKALGKITLMYNSPPVPGHKPRMEFIASQLKENLGADVELQSMEFAAYLDLLKKQQDQPHMWRMGWGADYPHPNNFLGAVFTSKSGQNYAKYNSTQFDKLVTDAARESDQTKQVQLYNQAQQLLVDDAPAIFLFHAGRFRLVKSYVKDIFITPMDPDPVGAFFYRLTRIAQH